MTQALDNARYDSVAAFIEAANTVLLNTQNAGLVKSYRETRDNGDASYWYGAGCKKGTDVQNLVMGGWSVGRGKVDTFLSQLETIELAPRDMRRRIVRADMGDHLDIGAVYAGRFDTAWTTAKRKTTYGPQRIDICANMICSGGDDEKVLFWRGAAAVALADKLENAGYMVRIIVGFGDVFGKTGNVSCRITVKEHGLPLDVATASAVIIPGFFRSIGHQWIAGHTKGKASWGGISVGRCLPEDGEVYLSHEINSPSSAKARVEQLIRDIDAKSFIAA